MHKISSDIKETFISVVVYEIIIFQAFEEFRTNWPIEGLARDQRTGI